MNDIVERVWHAYHLATVQPDHPLRELCREARRLQAALEAEPQPVARGLSHQPTNLMDGYVCPACGRPPAPVAEPQPVAWRMAPVEPTFQMKAAALSWREVDAGDMHPEIGMFVSIYRAMLAAAPAAPVAGSFAERRAAIMALPLDDVRGLAVSLMIQVDTLEKYAAAPPAPAVDDEAVARAVMAWFNCKGLISERMRAALVAALGVDRG